LNQTARLAHTFSDVDQREKDHQTANFRAFWRQCSGCGRRGDIRHGSIRATSKKFDAGFYRNLAASLTVDSERFRFGIYAVVVRANFATANAAGGALRQMQSKLRRVARFGISIWRIGEIVAGLAKPGKKDVS
jgi:hypothetical protein